MIYAALTLWLLAADEDAGIKKRGTHCKALDENSAVVLEHDSDGNALKCQQEIREAVKQSRCEVGKKLNYQFVGESLGKEMKPTPLTITCPSK
jgi:hypothetical protein